MKKLLIATTFIAISVLIRPSGLFADDSAFTSGLNAGLVQKYEGEVVDSYTGLMILNNASGADTYKGFLVQKMNTALFALSFLDREVKIRPEVLRQLTQVSSAQMKDFFTKFNNRRTKNGWQAEDPAQEEKIEWVISQYVKHGNIYGF
jgi:hypothetical protein